MTDRQLAIEAWESLFRAQHAVFTEISTDFEEGPLAQSEYDVLLTVMRSPGTAARLRDVTANMLISQPSVSRLVERMVAAGLIIKESDPDDGRGAIVRPTAGGASLFRSVASRHARSIADRMSCLTAAELTSLRDITAKLRRETGARGEQ